MIHQNTKIHFINEDIGYGVIATRFIPKGTIVWVQDKLDQEFTSEDVLSLEPLYKDILDTYAFKNNVGNHILCWDHARFVNHSFNSNCLATAYNFELAIRDIQAGEQVTDDYGYLNIEVPFRAIDEGTRRKIVYPDDLLRYHILWDKKLLSAFKRISLVEQPLAALISTELWQECLAIKNCQSEMKSILTNFYSGDS